MIFSKIDFSIDVVSDFVSSVEDDLIRRDFKINSISNTKEGLGGYYSRSNLRGNRQNFRLQDLQSTIQLPIPPSIKDMNSVDFAGGTMSGLAGAAFSPIVQAFLRRDKAFDEAIKGGDFRLRTQAFGVLKRLKSATGGVLGAVGEAIENPEFKRVKSLDAIAQAIAAGGINVDVTQQHSKRRRMVNG